MWPRQHREEEALEQPIRRCSSAGGPRRQESQLPPNNVEGHSSGHQQHQGQQGRPRDPTEERWQG